MPLDETLTVLALRRLRHRVYEPAGVAVAPSGGGAPANGAPSAAEDPATPENLARANANAWTALEVALGGEALWEKLRASWGNAEEDFCRRVRRFLDAVPLPDLDDADDEFRQACCRELRAARNEGLLRPGSLDLEELNRQVSQLNHVEGWDEFVRVEWEVLRRLAEELEGAGFPNLSTALALRLQGDQPFLVAAVFCFVRYRTGPGPTDDHPHEPDGADHLGPAAAEGFAGLAAALEHHGDWLDAFLADVHRSPPAPAPAAGATEPEEADGAALQEAIAFFNQGEYDRAIAAFSGALRADPENARAYAYRGEAHRFRCEYDQAVADLSQAVRLRPEQTQAYISRGLVFRLQGDPAAAIADYTEALRHDPRNAVALNNRGIARADRNEQDLAIADFSAAIEIDPQFFWAYHNRGKAYSIKSEYDAAIADHTRVLALNPNHAAVYTDRGDAYRLKGEFDRAIADYTAALRLDAQNARTLAGRGDTYRLKGDADRAIADYTDALRLNPANGEVLCHRGIMYRLKGDFGLALPDLNEALRLEPKNALAYYHRAKLHAAQGDLEQAVADYSEALWLQPGFSVFAYLDRALAYSRLGQLREVLVDCTRAIRLNPKLGPAYFLRGSGYADWPDHDKALADFTEAITLGPPFALAYQRRGLTYLQQGAYDLALADLAEAVRLDPRDPMTYAHRAVTYQMKGDHERAAADLARAFRLDPEVMLLCWTDGSLPTAREVYVPQISDYIEGRLPARKVPPPDEARAAPPAKDAARAAPPAAPPVRPGPATAEAAPTTGSKETVANARRQDLEQTVPDSASEPSRVPAAEQPGPQADPGSAEATPARNPAAAPVPRHAPAPEGDEKVRPSPEDLPEEAQPKARAKPKPRRQATTAGTKTIIGARSQAAAAQKTEAGLRPAAPTAVIHLGAAEAPAGGIEAPAAGDLLGRSVECTACRYDFVPSEVLDGGKVECARCQAVFVPELQEAPKEPPAPAPRPPKGEARPALVHKGPGGKKPSMSLPPWAGVALIAVLIVGVGLIVLLRKPSKPTSKTPRLVGTMSVEEFCRAYVKDPSGANKKYAGQFVDVQGVVEQVFREGEPRLVLQTPKDAGFTIECFVGHVNDLEGVEPGQAVSVKGQCETRPKPGANVKILMSKISLPRPKRDAANPDPELG